MELKGGDAVRYDDNNHANDDVGITYAFYLKDKQPVKTMRDQVEPSREGSVAQGALALKYIIELSHRVGQVLQHDPRTYSTMSLVLRVFWLPSVTSLFITPEFQNSNALLAQEWVGGPGGVST